MTPIEQADPPGNESRPCGANRGNYDEGTWQCPSCREYMDIAQQVACGCGYLVCQPCWQIAGNFGGACPSCGLPPDADKSRQQHRLVCRGDRSTSSSGGSTSSTSISGRSDTPQEPEENHVLGGGGGGGGGGGLMRQQQCQDGELQPHRDQQLRQDPARPGSEQRQQPQQSVFIRGADRRALQNLRVIRRTLVYAIGLSPNFAQVNTLKQPEYFGQYGDITKLVINHHQGVSPDDPRYGSASAYITFRRQEDAWAAICSVDGFRLMGRTIRASFGTTKYCNSFLRNLPCNNPDCLYLHELGDEGDRFTKDEVQLGLARHGSSFAFKEEVLGDRGGSSGHPRGSGGSADPGRATATPRPSNPVLPPPCPTTPPSHGVELGAGSAGMNGFAVGRGPGSPPYPLPGAYHPVLGPDHHGTGFVGVDGTWVGVQPGSPLPLGLDGRPRPRRRRGQRGRRGGGGGGSGAIPGSCCGGSVSSGDRCVAVNGAQVDAFTGRAAYDGDEGFVYGSRGARLSVMPVDSCQGGVSRSGSSGAVGSGGEGRTPPGHLPPAYLFQNERVGAYGQASNNAASLESASGRSRATDAACLTPLMRASTPSSPFLPASDRAPPSTARLNMERSDLGAGGGGGDVYRPVSKAMAHTWSGSDRCSGSNNSRSSGGGGGGGGSAYSGSGSGSGYWGMERGSPLNTSETLTNTPSIEPSPSDDSSSQLSLFGLAGASPQGVWSPPSLGDAAGVVRGKKDQVADAGLRPSGTAAPGASAAYAHHHHHRHVQMRPTPALFGGGDRGHQGTLGRQQTQQQQQQQDFRGGSRGGDLSSISELRQSDRHDRSQSLDLGLKQQYHHHQHHRQGEGEEQEDRQRRSHWYDSGVERGAIAAQQQQQQQQLQLQQRQQYFENDHGEARNDRRTKSSLLDDRSSYAGGAGIGQSPSLPPGLSVSEGGSGTGSRDPDDLSFVSESFAALTWDNASTGLTAASWDGFSLSPSAGSGARSGSGGGESREAFYRGEGMKIWAGPGLTGPESLAASQAEASQWRRATPRLSA